MLVERAISAEAAERARISLEKQVAEQAGKAQNEPPQASQATNPPQIMHKLGLTAEVHNAINELTRVFLGRSSADLQPLADLIGVPPDKVFYTFSPLSAIQFYSMGDRPYRSNAMLPHRIVGTLALSTLCGVPAFPEDGSAGSDNGNVSSPQLGPGDVMYWDGDRPCLWQSTAGGFALMWTADKPSIPKKA